MVRLERRTMRRLRLDLDDWVFSDRCFAHIGHHSMMEIGKTNLLESFALNIYWYSLMH